MNRNSDGTEAREALVQLVVNVGAILVAGVATMLVQRAVWRRVPRAMPRPAAVRSRRG